MNDLISRQAVKEWLAKWEGYIDADTIARMQYRVIDIPSAQPEWIPCSERLPKEDGQYLITEKGTFGDYLYVSIANYGVPCMPMNKGKGRGWFITDSEGDYYCDMNYVLAWMPLLKPYKGEQP